MSSLLPDIIREGLCIYDKRSDAFWDSGLENEPRQDCTCDRCFYGKDALAIYAITLLEVENE